MNRRKFLQSLTVTTAAIRGLSGSAPAAALNAIEAGLAPVSSSDVDIAGHTLVCEFRTAGASWKVYEDLRTRDGSMTFISSQGRARVLGKSAEAAFAEADKPYLGLDLKDIGMADRDLLAERLLEKGDPDPEMVKSAVPPQGTDPRTGPPAQRFRWETFVGTKECSDTMPVFPPGNTRTYHPVQFFPELPGGQSTEEDAARARKRFDGLVGGWMPAARKIFPKSDKAYYELIIFGDVEATDRFIVQTWHRTAMIDNGKIAKAVYGYSYPPYPPARQDPSVEEFYRALLVFADYWDRLLEDFPPTELPRPDWVDMSKHAFAKELMVRPGGVYPKYGAVDRDYYGPEYDGFQDTFTIAAYANLECGRFGPARDIIDNFLTDFVDSKGVNNMRGPETAHFGMTLSLLARYFNYTGDSALLMKHRGKIEASAAVLTDLHDESLKLPQSDPTYGIIRGWSESDACLAPTPMAWWLPYFANNGYSARGLKDLGQAYQAINRARPTAGMEKTAAEWLKRSQALRETVVASMWKSVRKDMNPPYIGVYAGAKLTAMESLGKENPSPYRWAHRPYAELLQADVLPHDLANLVVDSMRAYRATTIGILAGVGARRPTGRGIISFISYGLASILIRLDRIEDYLLFLYAHRYHCHTRGSWVAAETAGITGGTALFVIPAQQTIPLMIRWMLVLEDSDEDKLYLGKGLPRDWVGSGKLIRIQEAPTRWGRVDFSLQAQPAKKVVVGRVELAWAGAPRELQMKFRLPGGQKLKAATVNGRPATFSGVHGDTVAFETRNEKSFEVVAQYS